jgi:glycosyltransferase involved in cell wall biosynthesis
VGHLRIDRFRRWLIDDGFRVLIVRAGPEDGVETHPWGEEITVRDPIWRYRDSGTSAILRDRNALRRRVAHRLLNPDPGVIWARRASNSPWVIERCANVAFVISSSPPESAHVGAWMLARRLAAPHVVDMRDGWLDIPLKPLLRASPLRRWQEARLEGRILRSAALVFVTSSVWQTLLCERVAGIEAKTVVLTNGYPVGGIASSSPIVEGSEPVRLVHAGQFTASRESQSAELLLAPLLSALSDCEVKGVVDLIGRLTETDVAIIDRLRPLYQRHGWQIVCHGTMQRAELFESLGRAGGLLLLAASKGTLPSKFFEYIPTRRPILVVAERDSATWKACESLSQSFLIPTEGNRNGVVVRAFLQACKSGAFEADVPAQYTEAYLAGVMRQVMQRIGLP